MFGSILYCITGLGHTFLEGVVVVRSSDSSGLVVLGTELLVVVGNSVYIELGVLRTDLVFKVCFKDV